MDLTLFVTGTALFDSFSTTQQILVLVLLFSTARPIRTSLAFLVGVTVAYLVCGLVGLALVDRLNDMVKLFVPDLGNLSDGTYYQAELLAGLAMAVAGPAWGIYQQKRKKPPMANLWMEKLKRMNAPVAFGLGAFLSASSFPAALPYVAALEKIAAAPLSPLAKDGFVVLYNLVYAVPMLVPFGLFVVLRETIVPKLHLHVQSFNRWMTIAMVAGMGLFSMADAAAYFVAGHALVPTRFF